MEGRTDYPRFIMNLKSIRDGVVKIAKGFHKIAFVEDPAMEVDGIYLNNNTSIRLANNERQQVVAPLLIPDKVIFRSDPKGDYEIVFLEDSIRELRDDSQEKLKALDIFKDTHNGDIAPAFIIDEWIIEDENDKAYIQFGFNKKDVPLKTWMVHSQVIDKDFWINEIKNNKKFKYSIEAFMNFDIELNKNKNKINMENENKLVLPDGEHVIGDNIFVIKDGVVIEVKPVELEDELKNEEKKEALNDELDNKKEDLEEEKKEDENKENLNEDEKKEDLNEDEKKEEDLKENLNEDEKKEDLNEDEEIKAEVTKEDLEKIYDEIAKLREEIRNLSVEKEDVIELNKNKPYSGIAKLVQLRKNK